MSDQPWLKNNRWRGGQVRDSQHGDISLLWFAFLVTAILTPFIVRPLLALHQNQGGFFVIAIIAAIALPAFSLFLLVWALYRTARLLKYGRSTLELVTFPGVVGGQFIGIVYTKSKLPETHRICIRLACIHESIAGHGDTGSMKKDVLWSDEIFLVRTADENNLFRTAIPIAFTIPANARPTDQFEPCNRIFWKLTATANEPGIDYAASFEIPVYITPDSGKPPSPASDLLAPYRKFYREAPA